MKKKLLSLILTLALCVGFVSPALAAKYVEVAPCIYEFIFPFNEGVAPVCLNGEWRLIDTTGREVASLAKYDFVSSFSGGLITVTLNEKFGVINANGQEIITPKYDYIDYFADGLAKILLNGKSGVIDAGGREIVAPKYDDIHEFSDGLAVVTLNDKCGVIDSVGEEVIALGKYAFIQDFSEGLSGVLTGDLKTGKWGVIDKTGTEVVTPKYDYIGAFSEGLAPISAGPPRQEGVLGDQWGVVDKTGREVVALSSRYYNIQEFSEGLAAVFIGDLKTGKWGVIDKTGKEIVGPKYDTIGTFQNGLAVVMQNYKFGFINKIGQEVIPLKYGQAGSFSEGMAAVRLGDWQNGLWGLIDTTGKDLVAPQYESIEILPEGLVIIKLGNKFGLIDIMGQELAPPKYDEMKAFSDGLAAVCMDGKWGFIATVAVPAESPSFWAAEQVNTAIEEGLVVPSLQSKYTQAITRAEYCSLAVALYEKYTGQEITERRVFSDTTDVNIEKMAAVGVVSGIGNNLFAPEAKLTREQAAAILSRLADAIDKPLPLQASTFADNYNIADWAIESVGQVQAAGIMNGIGGNLFAPKEPYSREQSILTMIRLFDIVK